MATRTALFLALLFVSALPSGALAGSKGQSKAFKAVCKIALDQKDIPIEWVSEAQKAHEATQSPAEAQFARSVGVTGLTNASINAELARRYADQPPTYSLQLNRGVETDQGGSGRCWDFAGLNVIRRFPVAAGLLPENFEFSQTYIYWWHIFEQANDYLELLIRSRGTEKTPTNARDLANPAKHIHQGGWYERFAYLVDKYGLVPKQTMPDFADVVSRHGLMMDFLYERLAIQALELTARIEELKKAGVTGNEAVVELRRLKLEAMEEVRRILTISLGAPPSEFEWSRGGGLMRMKDQPRGDLRMFSPTLTFKGTPAQFYEKLIRGPGLDPLKDFAVVSASPFLAQGEVYAVKKDKFAKDSTAGSEYEQKTLNVSVDELVRLTEGSLNIGIPLWFAADMGRDVASGLRTMDPELFNYEAVYQLPGKHWASETEKRRALTYTQVVSPNHAMVIDGLYKKTPDGPVERWRVENSWGSPPLQGNRPSPWHMTARWYRENVYQIVVHKDVLGPELWKKWTEARPVVIKREAWMFGPEPK